MRQVVAYKRLKTMENHQPSGPKNGRGRLQEVGVLQEVPTVRLLLGKFWFFWWAVPYGRWSHTKGCRLWRFDCSWRENLLLLSWRSLLYVHSLRIFSPALPVGRGVYIVWRTFLNLSKMMYRLAFSGSRHFVSSLSFSCVDIVARRLGVSWK